MDLYLNILNSLRQQSSWLFQLQLFTLDERKITPWTLIEFVLLTAFLFIAAPKVNTLILKCLRIRISVDPGVFKYVRRLSRAIVVFIGFALIIHLIDLE